MNDKNNFPVIVAQNLCRFFGNFVAVDHVNFAIYPGEILAFLGPNGAGKTTVIKMIMGLLRISSGSIHILGLERDLFLKKMKTKLGYMSQKFSLYPLLNAYENLEFTGGIFRLSRDRMKKNKEDLSARIDPKLLCLPVQDIPSGMKQKIALFICLMTEPDIILLDEPTSGVDPEVRRKFWGEMYELKKKGKTVLVSTHYLDEAEYADRLMIINRGKIIRQGEPRALAAGEGGGSLDVVFKKAIAEHETI